LESLPQTPSGKLDRRALSALAGAEGKAREHRPPRGETARTLAGLWEAILDVHPVGDDDDFFALGGHSLLATQLMSRVSEVFHVALCVRVLFDAPRLCDLADRVALEQRTGRTSRPPLRRQARPAHLPLSYAQQRLWFLDHLLGRSPEYHMPAALRLRGEL